MTRREALTRIAYLMGGTLIATGPFLAGTRLEGKPPLAAAGFTKDDLALMDEIGETIIPTTDTPGAKAAHIGAFMALMVADCYDDAHQTLFQVGLKKIDETSHARFGKSFRQASPAQRTDLLNALDVEQKDVQRKKNWDELPHYFRLVKELTLVGYFTSEIGASQTLSYVEIPGRLDGNVLYKKGDRACFTPPSRSLQ
jgi:hypothetical protein